MAKRKGKTISTAGNGAVQATAPAAAEPAAIISGPLAGQDGAGPAPAARKRSTSGSRKVVAKAKPAARKSTTKRSTRATAAKPDARTQRSASTKKPASAKPTAKRASSVGRKSKTKTAKASTTPSSPAPSAAPQPPATQRSVSAYLVETKFAELWQDANALHLAQAEVGKLSRQLREREAQIARMEAEQREFKQKVKQRADQRILDLRLRHSSTFNRLRLSASYQIGQAMVLAVRHPGRNTLLLPVRIARIAAEALMIRFMR